LENHPTVISEEAKKIKLSKKTGIPLGVLPNQQAPATKKGGDDLGKARPKQENKEERKARKAQVKESRRVTLPTASDLLPLPSAPHLALPFSECKGAKENSQVCLQRRRKATGNTKGTARTHNRTEYNKVLSIKYPIYV